MTRARRDAARTRRWKPFFVGDAEVLMARAAVRVGAVLAVPIVASAGLLRGVPGALTALGGVALVVGVVALTGRSLAWAAGHGPAVLQATALGGFALRLMIYAGAIVVLRPVDAVDGPVLAITVAVTVIVVLATEARFVLRNPQIWWVDATAPGTHVKTFTKSGYADRPGPPRSARPLEGKERA